MTRKRFFSILASEGVNDSRVQLQAWNERPRHIRITEKELRLQCKKNLQDHILKIANQSRKETVN